MVTISHVLLPSPVQKANRSIFPGYPKAATCFRWGTSSWIGFDKHILQCFIDDLFQNVIVEAVIVFFNANSPRDLVPLPLDLLGNLSVTGCPGTFSQESDSQQRHRVAALEVFGFTVKVHLP